MLAVGYFYRRCPVIFSLTSNFISMVSNSSPPKLHSIGPYLEKNPSLVLLSNHKEIDPFPWAAFQIGKREEGKEISCFLFDFVVSMNVFSFVVLMGVIVLVWWWFEEWNGEKREGEDEVIQDGFWRVRENGFNFERERERFKRERWVGRWSRLREKKGGESGRRRQPLSTPPRAVVGGRAQIRERERWEKRGE